MAPRADRETQENLAIENSTLEAMADARLGGNIADVYAPKTRKLEEIRNALSYKVRSKQAFHLILNLSRVPEIQQADVVDLLRRKPIEGLRELFIVERNGAINRVFPESEQIVIPPLQ